MIDEVIKWILEISIASMYNRHYQLPNLFQTYFLIIKIYL